MNQLSLLQALGFEGDIVAFSGNPELLKEVLK